ncbi:MAG: REase, partial [Acidimicrobiaceae bacterium]
MECDSLEHHFSKAEFEWDRRRRRHLKRLGWEVAEWTYAEVKDGSFVPELRELLVLASRTSRMRSG